MPRNSKVPGLSGAWWPMIVPLVEYTCGASVSLDIAPTEMASHAENHAMVRLENCRPIGSCVGKSQTNGCSGGFLSEIFSRRGLNYTLVQYVPAEETITLRATWVFISQTLLLVESVNMAAVSTDPYWTPSKGLHLYDATAVDVNTAQMFVVDIAVIACDKRNLVW